MLPLDPWRPLFKKLLMEQVLPPILTTYSTRGYVFDKQTKKMFAKFLNKIYLFYPCLRTTLTQYISTFYTKITY